MDNWKKVDFEMEMADRAVWNAQRYRRECRVQAQIQKRMNYITGACSGDPEFRASRASAGCALNDLRLVARAMREAGYRFSGGNADAARFLWNTYAAALAYEKDSGILRKTEVAAPRIRAALAARNERPPAANGRLFGGMDEVLAGVYAGIDVARLPRRFCALDADFDAGTLLIALDAAKCQFLT